MSTHSISLNYTAPAPSIEMYAFSSPGNSNFQMPLDSLILRFLLPEASPSYTENLFSEILSLSP